MNFRDAAVIFVALGLLCAAPAIRGQVASGHAEMSGHATSMTTAEEVALQALLDSTRRGTAQFADRRAAIRAGYRRVGMDFPSMGEHWINPSKLISGEFDPGSPAILTYALINGEPRLLGVVYAVALGPHERPPTVAGGFWHEHNGSIDDESLLPEHGGDEHSVVSSNDVAETRLAILHVWTVATNPAGIFVAENWALPFVRNGIEVPSPIPVSAARALALVSGGLEYYRSFFRIGPNASANDEAALRLAMRDARAIRDNRRSRSAFSPEELAALSTTWERFVTAVHR
jgi:hypothetical protein